MSTATTSAFDDGWIERKAKLYANRVRAAGIMLQNDIRQIISTPSRMVSYRESKPTKRQLKKADMIRRGHQLLSQGGGNISAEEMPEVKALTGTQVRKKLGKRGSNRSKPGDPPHKDYGRLRMSIQTEFAPVGSDGNPTTRVGTNLAYGKYLEFGTKNMRARPYIRRMLKENKQRIIDLVSRGEVVSIDVG